jgi:hypothetical protein
MTLTISFLLDLLLRSYWQLNYDLLRVGRVNLQSLNDKDRSKIRKKRSARFAEKTEATDRRDENKESTF